MYGYQSKPVPAPVGISKPKAFFCLLPVAHVKFIGDPSISDFLCAHMTQSCAHIPTGVSGKEVPVN